MPDSAFFFLSITFKKVLSVSLFHKTHLLISKKKKKKKGGKNPLQKHFSPPTEIILERLFH